MAAPLERVEFEGASQPRIPGDRIQGHLAKPDGASPFPAVIALHGCGGMHDTTKQKLADDLVAWGYVALLVDSFTTRGIVHACTGGISGNTRTADAYGGLVFLARQTFVDPRRVGAIGFSQGAWIALVLADNYSVELFARPLNLRFRAAAALYPPCRFVGLRPGIPTLILIGALDDWTPAADCSHKVAFWGTDGPPIDLVVYPGAHHSFYYPHFQPGMTIFGHWVEYNGEAADDATRRIRELLDRNLK